MKSKAQGLFSEPGFFCPHCGYRSPRDLTECPGCGRIVRRAARSGKRRDEVLEMQLKKLVGVRPDSPSPSVQAAEGFLYECAHCRYRTLNSFGECPECGRLKSAKISVFAEEFDERRRRERAGGNDIGTGKLLLLISPAFFVGAFLVFLGHGPAGRGNKGTIVAAVGDNWAGAMVLLIVGIVFLVFGAHFKNKD